VRLRGPALVLSVLILAAVAVAVVAHLLSGSPGHRPRHIREVALAPVAPRQRIPKSEAALELAAVKRFAAFGLPLYCGGRERRMVALTFDDGPGPYTRLALKKLRQFHARATFFLVGKSIEGFPGLARREKPYGAFGDHTMTHPFLPALSHAEMVREIAGDRALIERTVGEPIDLFRPPYEATSSSIQRELRHLGMLEVLWNVDSTDSVGGDYAAIERIVLRGLRPGSIVLMHENHGQTIRALPTILAALKRDRLTAVTIPQLLAEDPPSPHQLRSGEPGCSVMVGGTTGG
jgi:peptidoglycan/xylan/chitin deacetylase (PgdA/CDA1 family)